MANTTWSSTDKNGMTISGAGLIATGSPGINSVRSTDRLVVGQHYWENTITSLSAGFAVGVASDAASIGLSTGGGNYVAQVDNGGFIKTNFSLFGTSLGTRAAGDIIGIAEDLDTGQVWFRVCPSGNWNGSASADPATGVGGCPLITGAPIGLRVGGGGVPVHAWASAGNTGVITANFGDSAFSGAVPAGYTSGFPVVSVPTVVFASQAGVETFIGGGSPAIRVSQVGLEVFYSLVPALVLTQIGAEVFIDHSAGYSLGGSQSRAMILA
jgi:hypothetical protein